MKPTIERYKAAWSTQQICFANFSHRSHNVDIRAIAVELFTGYTCYAVSVKALCEKMQACFVIPSQIICSFALQSTSMPASTTLYNHSIDSPECSVFCAPTLNQKCVIPQSASSVPNTEIPEVSRKKCSLFYLCLLLPARPGLPRPRLDVRQRVCYTSERGYSDRLRAEFAIQIDHDLDTFCL